MPRTHPEVGGKLDNGDMGDCQLGVTGETEIPQPQSESERRVSKTKEKRGDADREALFSDSWSVLLCPTFLQCWRLEK